MDDKQKALTQLALSLTPNKGVVLAKTEDNRLLGFELDASVNQMTGDTLWEAIPIHFNDVNEVKKICFQW